MEGAGSSTFDAYKESQELYPQSSLHIVHTVHLPVLLSASPAADDKKYRTPVEAAHSRQIGVLAIIFLTSSMSLIVALDVFYFLHKVRLSAKINPRKESARHSGFHKSASPIFGYARQPPPYYVNSLNVLR